MLTYSPELVDQIVNPPNYTYHLEQDTVEGMVRDLLYNWLTNNINYIHNMQHRHDLVADADPKLVEAVSEKARLIILDRIL